MRVQKARGGERQMKTVMIVEDEKMIRQGLHAMIKRCGVPVDVIIECRNGEEALEMLSYQPVDVLFTDIRMPKMDGIELVRRLHEMPDMPLVVAISGYDDFSYAVEMLRNGVREYLLKPIDRDKICQVMQTLEQELEQRNRSDEKERQIGRQQLRHILQSKQLPEKEIELLKQKYGTYFFKEPYKVCCTEPENGLRENEYVMVIDGVDDGMVCLVEQSSLTPFLMNEFPDSSVGISGICQGIEELRKGYEEALEARKKAFCLCSVVTWGEEERSVPQGLKEQAEKLLGEQACQQRIQLIGSGRTEELDEQWGRLFTEVKRGRIKPDAFFTSMEDALKEIVRIYGDVQEEKLLSFLAYPDLERYREEVMEWIMELHRRRNSQEETHGAEHKMQLAVEYIEANYNKDLNMAVVSNHLSMNYSLFSYSFKQYTGTSFVSFLKDIRIREAKRLLCETDLKIQEISVQVGYENEKHFMKTFRSQCGVSPTEYRKNMSGTAK